VTVNQRNLAVTLLAKFAIQERILCRKVIKSSYTDKQKRQAAHIEAGYEKKGVSVKNAEARAWANVNKLSGGGKLSGSARKHL
jgi:hypothetical protein